MAYAAVNPLAVINTVTGVTGLVTGIFSDEGPDKDKYAERGKFISSLVGMAQAGDIRAWYALGAYGWPKIKTPVALAAPYSRPPKYGGDGKLKPIGWALDGNEWGDAYKPLRESANDAYQKLAYKFNPSAPPASGGGIIHIPPPPPITTGWTIPTDNGGGPIVMPPPPGSFPGTGGDTGGGAGGGGNGNNLPTYAPTPSYRPATMDPAYPAGGPAPIAQAGILGLSPTAIGVSVAIGLLGLVVSSRPQRNPPRRRRARRGHR